MTRPFLPKMLAALQEYEELDESGRYKYRLTEIALKHNVTVPSLSRAARKKGILRYLTRGVK